MNKKQKELLSELSNIIELNTIKVCINQFEPTDSPFKYRHPDLYKFAIKAKSENRKYFYCKPEDPKKPFGRLVECEPVYEYIVKIECSEDQYNELLQKIKDISSAE